MFVWIIFVHPLISTPWLLTIKSGIADALLLTLNIALVKKKKVTEKTNQTLIKLITFCRSGGRENCKAHVFISDWHDIPIPCLVSRWKSHFKTLHSRTGLKIKNQHDFNLATRLKRLSIISCQILFLVENAYSL